MSLKLFRREQVAGIFRGFSEGGLEFHADLVLPYREDYQNSPMHGQFVVVQLETESEAVLGRICSISAEGRLTSSEGEDYGVRAVAEDRPIPEELRERYLKYRINIRVLGVVRVVGDRLVFAASHRRLPHLGSKVAFLAEDVLREVAGHNLPGAELGYLALGEYIFAGDDVNGTNPAITVEDWMQIRHPKVTPKFDIRGLVSRRSFVFARAGFGKSNLTKLLFSSLYRDTPTVQKRGGRRAPVGTIIFDPEGEYFWPDDQNRPGLCDVPHLEDKLVLFTNRRGPSPFYDSFVASDIRLDIRRLRPADVVSIALPPEKQDQQNVRRLKQLNDSDWSRLVDEIYAQGNLADAAVICELLHLDEKQEAEMAAARANMTTIVKMLHDPGSQMLDMLINSLKAGKLCIVDLSQMRGQAGLILSALILQRIFDYNQEQFTRADPETIPVIAVVEEAQAVLGSSGGTSGYAPYVTWVKEGRKYDLGAVLITQQPGSIPHEILSQGDNWFVFHLLSTGDLLALKKANAHFSDDILSALLNEPIPGHCVFWSSAGGKSYPVSLRVMSFEKMYTAADPTYTRPAAPTYAAQLRATFATRLASIPGRHTGPAPDSEEGEGAETTGTAPVDTQKLWVEEAVKRIQETDLPEKVRTQGHPWKGIQVEIEGILPDHVVDKDHDAYRLMPQVLDALFGKGAWTTERRPKKKGPGYTVYVTLKNASPS